MTQTRIPYVNTIRRVASAAATYVIQAEQLNAGDSLVLENIGYTNETSNNKDIALGFKMNGRDVWFAGLEGAANGLYFQWVGPMTIASEHRLIFKVLSPGAGDVTVINVVGYIIPKCDPAGTPA